MQQVGRAITGAGRAVACLAVAVAAPGPDVVALVDGKGVALARGNVLDFAATDANLLRDVAALVPAAEEAAAELVLIVDAPAPDASVLVQG